MSIIVSSDGACAGSTSDLIAHLEYYEAVFEKNGLVARESEFRSVKLGLAVELLRITGIPDNLKTEITSAIIDAWRLEAPEMTLSERERELSAILQGIKAVKGAARWSQANYNYNPMIGRQLDVAVMFALPLASSDLKTESVSKVRDLLCQVMDHYAAAIGGGVYAP